MGPDPLSAVRPFGVMGSEPTPAPRGFPRWDGWDSLPVIPASGFPSPPVNPCPWGLVASPLPSASLVSGRVWHHRIPSPFPRAAGGVTEPRRHGSVPQRSWPDQWLGAGAFAGFLAWLKQLVPSLVPVMARLLRLLAAIPLLSLTVVPALASGRYQVQPRDSFYSIARKCRVDVYELMRLNPRPNNALKLGEELRLPSNAQCGSGAGSAGAAATNPAYQVQLRDSFYSVARKCRVDVGELMRLNPRPDNALKLGEQLRLPGNAQCGSGAGSAGAAATNLAYQVQPREGFYTIARKCQVDAKELMRLNSASGVSLQPGQQLTLPGNARCPAQSTTVASAGATPRSTTTNTNTTTTVATGGATLFYEVQAHEGFYSIAQKCQVDTRQLININPDTPTVLRAGLRLRLPANARCPEPSVTVAAASGARSYYQVQPRDSFYSIARKCRVDAKAFMALNPRPGNLLQVGEQLELPAGAQCTTVAAANPDPATTSGPSTANRGGETLDSGWRSYGPLKVDWQDWKMIEGHWVAKSMNNNGQQLYVAINCPNQRINKTGGNGQWSTWDVPDPGFEERLMNDLCQEKKGQG